MKFEGLKDFDWYNEPENVVFGSNELKVIAKSRTDFWQSRCHNFSKDDGHFFYTAQTGGFTCLVKWRLGNIRNYNQCGLMLRLDNHNWFKVSVMSENENLCEIGHCLTRDGDSDWANVPVFEKVDSLWYKIVRYQDDYIAFYSLDGENFVRLRRFSMPCTLPQIQIGAYICAPQDSDFAAFLEEIDVR